MTRSKAKTMRARVGRAVRFSTAVAAAALLLGSLSACGEINEGRGTDSAMIKVALDLQKTGDVEESVMVLRRLVEAGHPEAMYHLGRAHRKKLWSGANLDQARVLFERAVEQTFEARGEAAYELGRLYQRMTGVDCQIIALAWFKQSLGWGYPKAHVQLAAHFRKGIGVDADMTRALHHYRQAAIHGFPTATIQYARLLRDGIQHKFGHPEDAQYWADRAIGAFITRAREGSSSAAKTLARMGRDGEFLPQDRLEAEVWFRRSAQLGDIGAVHELAKLLLQDREKNTVAGAVNLLRHAADLGHSGAMVTLARLHLKEEGGLKREGAIALLKQGKALGHAGAMEELGRLYAQGDLVEKDVSRAIELATAGSALGHAGSRSLLADLSAKL